MPHGARSCAGKRLKETTMCDQPQPTGIYQAMAEILAEIPSIGKDNKN